MDGSDDRGGLTPEMSGGTSLPRARGASPGMKVFYALVIIGFGAAGFGALKTYFDNRTASSALEERGVEADARVSSVTEISGRRIETYHELSISYDPPGPRLLEFAEVQDCSGQRYLGATPSVEIVYLPDDPDTVRLSACRSSFDSNILPGILGLVFVVIALFLPWRLRRVWTS